MKTSTYYHLGNTALVFLLTSSVFFNTACAMGSKGKAPIKSTAKGTETYVWYDGAQQRIIWLNPSLLAEINTGAAGTSAVRQAFPNARELPSKQAAVRLWQLEGDTAAKAAIAQLRGSHPSGRFSPVFHDARGGGRKRALPGNIIVYFNPAWSPPQIEQWARDRGLEIVEKMRFGQNVYVIRTGPGLEALEMANRLYESGEVAAAFPNWWKEVTTR